MERVMSVEERIRRAEDIYNRRNGQYSRTVPKVKEKKEKHSTVKKMLMQIFICLSIYVIFYAVTNREYIFSEQFRNEVNSFFTEKTKIYETYLKVETYIKNSVFGEDKEKESNINVIQDDVNQGNVVENNVEENVEVQENTVEQSSENIGGAQENIPEGSEENIEIAKEELSEEEQMKKDADDIKSKINFIVPVVGRISSTFGWRNPTTDTVPKYHTGLDIAANEGTVIKSATDGKVILASTQGDYGNHYKIQIDDVIIIYAHCKKLYLKEGDEVKQGQEIAEVGSTGNSTGPHLHFEVRKDDKKIDPQLILDI